MTKAEAKKLMKEIAVLSEMSYRRGFQQGVWFSRGSEEFKNQAYIFRFNKKIDKDYGAPERYNDGKVKIGQPIFNSIIERHIGVHSEQSSIIRKIYDTLL